MAEPMVKVGSIMRCSSTYNDAVCGRANEALEKYGQILKLLLNRWALEGSEANSIFSNQLVVPVSLSFGPFMAWGGQKSMVRGFVRRCARVHFFAGTL